MKKMIKYIMRCIQVIGNRKNKKKLLVGAIIIPILLTTDKIVISLSYRD